MRPCLQRHATTAGSMISSRLGTRLDSALAGADGRADGSDPTGTASGSGSVDIGPEDLLSRKWGSEREAAETAGKQSGAVTRPGSRSLTTSRPRRVGDRVAVRAAGCRNFSLARQLLSWAALGSSSLKMLDAPGSARFHTWVKHESSSLQLCLCWRLQHNSR